MLPEVGVVLDAGTGMHRLGAHLTTDRLDVFLSHSHLDHVAGLTYLINVVPQDVLAHTVVHGDAAKLNAIREHLFAEQIFPVAPPFTFEPLSHTCPLPAGGTLTSIPLEHPGGSLGFRLDWPDRSLAYITDTTASENANYVDAIRGVDLLIHEAYFTTDKADVATLTGHSTLDAVAAVAARANVGRLVLVHLDPFIDCDEPFDLSEARSVFPSIETAHDEMEFDF